MKIAIYVRVSTDRQEQEETKETQLFEVNQAITNDGFSTNDVLTYLDDGWSGGYLARPSLDELRQDAAEKKFDKLYVFDKGRLSRVFIHQELLIKELSEAGIDIKSLHDINPTNMEEVVMSQVMGVFHEYERLKIAERFRLGKLNKVRRGRLLGYNPPYGYDYIPVSGHGHEKQNGSFEINEKEAEVVKKIFGWIANEALSVNEVIRRLHSEGIAPRKAKRPQWTKSPLVRLLRNETYVGRHYYYKTEAIKPKKPTTDRKYFKHTDKTSRRARDRSEWLMVEVEPIIDEMTFQKVQTQLDKNLSLSPRNANHEYLVRGLIYCECDSKRTGEGARGHYYYRCTERLHTFPEPATCVSKGINASVLDSVIWDNIAILLTEPKLLEQQYKMYAKETAETSSQSAQLVDLEKKLTDLRDEEKRYISAYGRGSLSDELFDEHMLGINKNKQDLNLKISQLKKSTPKALPAFESGEIAKRFSELIAELDFTSKRFVVESIVEKIVATKENVTICGRIPLLTPSTTLEAGLHANDWHRRLTKRRQVHPIQRTN